jgi:hypothetical protein
LWQFTFERAAFGDAIRKQLEKAKSPGDIAALLRREKIAFREQPSVRTAEQFPMEVLPKITALSKSDVVVLNTPSEAAVLYAVDFVDQPATLEQATPIIERYLLSARKQKQVEARLKELRSTAKIEYVASAAQALTAAPGEPAHQQESGVGATPKVQQPVAASSDEPGVANDKADRHVGQGLLGTKK